MAEQSEKITPEKLAEIIKSFQDTLAEICGASLSDKLLGVIPKGFVPTGEKASEDSLLETKRALYKTYGIPTDKLERQFSNEKSEKLDSFEKILKAYRTEMTDSFKQAGMGHFNTSPGGVNDCLMIAWARVHCRILGIDK